MAESMPGFSSINVDIIDVRKAKIRLIESFQSILS